MDAVSFMKNVSIFSHLGSRDLKRLARQIKYKTLQQGEVILREGERGTSLYVVVRRRVEVVKNLGAEGETRLQVFGPNSYFGEMALWDDLVRSASVVALEDTEVIYLDRFDFRRAIEKSPGLAVEIFRC